MYVFAAIHSHSSSVCLISGQLVVLCLEDSFAEILTRFSMPTMPSAAFSMPTVSWILIVKLPSTHQASSLSRCSLPYLGPKSLSRTINPLYEKTPFDNDLKTFDTILAIGRKVILPRGPRNTPRSLNPRGGANSIASTP